MQLVIKNGLVVADHPDSDTVKIAAYGAGARVVDFAGVMADLGRVGTPPAAGERDLRPYAAPPIDLPGYAATVRYAREIAGITVNGLSVATDRDSQAKIANAYALLQASGAASIEFKGRNGFATLTADQFKALALAVGAHVQACFAKEADVDSAITAGTIADLDGVDAAFAALAA